MQKNLFFPSLAFVLASVIIAFGLGKIIKEPSSVQVRGLAQKEVPADLALWPLNFSIGGNDLAALKTSIEEKTKIATEFLRQNGLSDDDFIIQATTITDNTLNQYIQQNQIRYNFIAKIEILVRTSKIAAAKNAYINAINLASQGIAVSNDYGDKISFEFTGLNDIKPEMIAQATKNARAAAAQFAADSGSKVGKIKRATQGLFSVQNAAMGLEDIKTVRVVTQIEYTLE